MTSTTNTSTSTVYSTPNSAKIKAVRRRQEVTSKGFVYTLLIIGALVFVLPLVVMVSTSLKSYAEINSYPPTFLPNQIVPSNFVEAWNYPNTMFPRWTFNTIFIIVATVPGVVLSSSLCAYGFARLRFPGRNLWFMLVLASLMLPAQVTLIPLYILFHKLGWLNTFAPLIVPAWFGGGAINIFLMRQFFMQIPRELDEAAIIDGAGHLTIWWKIYLPLARPALISVTLLTILGIWNDFLNPFIFLSDPNNFTISLGLNLFRNYFPQLARTDYIMAISTLMVIPMIVMFLAAQRYIVSGFVTSGIKG
ncbi:MAG: carbohydrate ABC transporter permease [Chloroflexi bacterium]|nr:carbohydrate ABC transporter permease [Chloroflexota bacterium]MCC6891690.1 carbohydrate ABC transporter permease [Anaerolineae bacterium]